MTPDDARKIETSLGVALPSDYRHLLLNHPVVFERGTTDGALWDDANSIVERNLELRSKRRSLGTDYEALPTRYLFVGDDGGGWQHLLDLESDPPLVCIMEFEAVASISPALDDNGNPQPINVWYHNILADMRDGGTNISSTEPPAAKLSLGCVLGVAGFCLIAALAIALMVAGIQFVTGR